MEVQTLRELISELTKIAGAYGYDIPVSMTSRGYPQVLDVEVREEKDQRDIEIGTSACSPIVTFF